MSSLTLTEELQTALSEWAKKAGVNPVQYNELKKIVITKGVIPAQLEIIDVIKSAPRSKFASITRREDTFDITGRPIERVVVHNFTHITTGDIVKINNEMVKLLEKSQ
jgi:hypothetical protein